MYRYRNSSGSSGVSSYEIGDDFIVVKFSSTYKTYKYSYARAGKMHVDRMKQLAMRGRGLNSYINRNVKNLYD